jgi:hypothetical protein
MSALSIFNQEPLGSAPHRPRPLPIQLGISGRPYSYLAAPSQTGQFCFGLCCGAYCGWIQTRRPGSRTACQVTRLCAVFGEMPEGALRFHKCAAFKLHCGESRSGDRGQIHSTPCFVCELLLDRPHSFAAHKAWSARVSRSRSVTLSAPSAVKETGWPSAPPHSFSDLKTLLSTCAPRKSIWRWNHGDATTETARAA